MEYFDIIDKDIANLNDSQLRELIGRLCEADYQSAGFSTKGITWGGDQDAADGGLDVVVCKEDDPPQNSFIPRKITGFQVKKPNMPPKAITSEMRPKGTLRPEIVDLINKNGAYIIVSSGSSVTHKRLKERRNAMSEAVALDIKNNDFSVDFMDRGQVASWARCHPSIMIWIHSQIGSYQCGWRSYENWANPSAGVKEEYLIDDELRLIEDNKPISLQSGIQKLRLHLNRPGTSIRLVGLSGVGKTRFIQALFDERIGENTLNHHSVIYTDNSDAPKPDPITFVRQLIAESSNIILIIDNCSPDLHRQLTKICSADSSTVKLLTAEYDVRDDIPENTNAFFKLEPASDAVIEKILKRRFSSIGEANIKRIAEFSGGNFRIAALIANNCLKNPIDLSAFKDDTLFERLFHQRNNKDDSLLKSAEICSLLYSFEGNNTESETSELKLLSSLINIPVDDLYRNVQLLKKRNLVQARGNWKAILPHALANWLAKQALELITDSKIELLLKNSSARVLKSFTRRLGMLHDSEKAVQIVTEWLDEEGWIGKEINNFNELGFEIFRNIAPVSPLMTLKAIEGAANNELFTSTKNKLFYRFAQLLRHIAYDAQFFQQSINIICKYIFSDSSKDRRNTSTYHLLKSLFHVRLSGSNAPLKMRAEVINNLLNSDNLLVQELGIDLLDAAIEVNQISVEGEFHFGSRPRGFGYQPQSRDYEIEWFKTFINICTEVAVSKLSIATQAKQILSNKLSSLWVQVKIFDVLEKSIHEILNRLGSWYECSSAINEIIRVYGKGFEIEILTRIKALENLLRPKNILHLTRYVLSDCSPVFHSEEDASSEDAISIYSRGQIEIQSIGAKLAKKESVLNELFPEIFSSRSISLFCFGKGLAEGAKDKKMLWHILCNQFIKMPKEKRQTSVLHGFLFFCFEKELKLCQLILDEALADNSLSEYFPGFQTSLPIVDEQGFERLKQALDSGKANIRAFTGLSVGVSLESIEDDNFACLIKKISSKEGGLDLVLKILIGRFDGINKKQPASNKLLSVCREFLLKYLFNCTQSRYSHCDYALNLITNICLNKKQAVRSRNAFIKNMLKSILSANFQQFDYPQLLSTLAKFNGSLFLDYYFLRLGQLDYWYKTLFSYDCQASPFKEIADGTVIDWCEKNPTKHYLFIAQTISVISKSPDTKQVVWNPIIYSIFQKAPNLVEVLEILSSRLLLTSTSCGSRVDMSLTLFQQLFHHQNIQIIDWAKNKYELLQGKIKQTDKQAMVLSQRFE